ncbi:MAG: LysR family transcriptional regulator [Ruminococcus sp.]|uniref:LysR family transcriptional regulator n=1 Tax=Ruminococcus sp. TaxID=41978 RepID=UPI0025F23F7D|nr:LysR family transcriptional regulator [Ruminococcus sp.]MCR5600782.1 LysR family transcriptional regulator [Ruminococcus sp.]
MDIRVLRYFLAVAREQSFSTAAERLFLSQPTLSRQLKELECELGKTLLIRSNKGVSLTEDGMILRKRAEEIVELMDKTEQEVRQSKDSVSGTVYIGAGETYAIKLIADTAHNLKTDYPDIRYSFFSGNGTDVLEKLERGLLDFGLIFGSIDRTKYEAIEIPLHDTWGVLMRRDEPLAQKKTVTIADLMGLNLIIPRQLNHLIMISELIAEQTPDAHIVAEYNLIYNASVMVNEGIGTAITLDRIINVSGDSDLCFRPFEPRMEAVCSFIWKRYPVFSKAAVTFLEQFRKDISALL